MTKASQEAQSAQIFYAAAGCKDLILLTPTKDQKDKEDLEAIELTVGEILSKKVNIFHKT